MLKPSDAHLWMPCPLAGQVIASGEYHATSDPNTADDDDSDDRREGICAHWVAEMCFREPENHPSEFIGQAHANGWVVDAAMVEHVADYLTYVESFGPVTAVETPVHLFNLISGRLDTVSNHSPQVVRIFDLKYGWKLVEADRNWAMLCYGISVAMGRDVAIELHIFQPRPSHPEGPARVWTIPAHEVPSMARWLEDKARDCFVYPEGKPGSQCLVCPARGSCAALTANVYAQYEILTDDRMSNHSPAELGAFLTFLHNARDLVKAKLSGIEAEATARINRGTMIPRWTLEQKKGNRVFTVDPEKVRMATGISPVKSVPMSPAELERAGAPKHVVALITDRPTIGRKLTNNPEAIANRMFGKPQG